MMDMARSLSGLISTVVYSKYGCLSCHYTTYRKAVSLHKSSNLPHLSDMVQRSFADFSTKGPENGMQMNNDKGMSGGKCNQEAPEDVEPEQFHFHSACKPDIMTSVSSSFKLMTNFISKAEEEILMREVEPHLKRLKYEFDHWDDAIHGFRELEKSRWSQQASFILSRVHEAAFPNSSKQLPQTHVLDLAKSGVIKPHVDSVRFCGNIICGLCLLSDAVMRLRHVKLKDQVIDILLKRGSLYIMRDEARYKFTHEVLEDNECFRGEKVLRGRRVSIISRNHPTEQPPVDDATHV